MDDESGQFLVKTIMYEPAAATLEHAKTSQLPTPEDADLLRGLFDAAERGEGVGRKAGSRAVRSTRNIVFAVVAAVAPLLCRVPTQTLSASELSTRLDRFLGSSRSDVLELVNDLPPDIRLAVEAIFDLERSSLSN